HLAVFWRNLSCIYLVLTFLGLAVFGLLRLGGDWLSRWFGTPGFVASMGMAAANALSRWWWLPIGVLAVAIVPCALAYWLAPKLGTRASFSFFPVAAWSILLAG